jgi:ABC-type transporter Mla subunit MlaD
MTNQEIEKAIEFVLNQQAQFSEDLRQLHEVLATQTRQIATQTELMSRQNEAVVFIIGSLGKIADVQTAAEPRLSGLETQVATLTERLDTLSERVDAFITFVGAYIERHNGNDQP